MARAAPPEPRLHVPWHALEPHEARTLLRHARTEAEPVGLALLGSRVRQRAARLAATGPRRARPLDLGGGRRRPPRAGRPPHPGPGHRRGRLGAAGLAGGRAARARRDGPQRGRGRPPAAARRTGPRPARRPPAAPRAPPRHSPPHRHRRRHTAAAGRLHRPRRRRRRTGGRTAAERRRAGGRRVLPHRRVAARGQGRRPDTGRAGGAADVHGLRGHHRRGKPRRGAGGGHRRPHRGGPRRRPRLPHPAARRSTGPAPGAHPQGAARHPHRRRPGDRPVPAARQPAATRGQRRGRRGRRRRPRRAAAGRDRRPDGRRPPPVPPGRAGAHPAHPGGARPGRHRLLRQDRHPHREPPPPGAGRHRRRRRPRPGRRACRPGRTARGARPPREETAEGRKVAHATDEAVLDAAPPDENWTADGELAFEASRGYAAAVGRDGQDGAYLVVKGAPETVLPVCADLPEEAAGAAHTLAGQGLRVLAVARRRYGGTDPEAEVQALSGLELVGFVALADVPRDTSRELLTALRESGILPVMLTGDHPETARAIALQLGWPEETEVVTGDDLVAMGRTERVRALHGAGVVARVAPEQKLHVVEALQQAGRVVAMVNDGANDAAAIRAADVGVGIESRGSAAARNAADIVLTGGDLSVLVDAFTEGRALWRSVADAVSILIGGNAKRGRLQRPGHPARRLLPAVDPPAAPGQPAHRHVPGDGGRRDAELRPVHGGARRDRPHGPRRARHAAAALHPTARRHHLPGRGHRVPDRPDHPRHRAALHHHGAVRGGRRATGADAFRTPSQHPGVGDRAGLRRGSRRAGADARRQPLLRLRPLGPLAWTGVALAITLSALAPAWNASPRSTTSTPWPPASPSACPTPPATPATSCTRGSPGRSPEGVHGFEPRRPLGAGGAYRGAGAWRHGQGPGLSRSESSPCARPRHLRGIRSQEGPRVLIASEAADW